MGDWKFVSSNFGSTQGGAGTNEWELYRDLSVDPTESNDLAGDPAFADKFNQMLAGYNRWAYQNDVTATFPWSAADFNKDGLLDTADLTAFQAGWLMHAALGSNTTFRGATSISMAILTSTISCGCVRHFSWGGNCKCCKTSPRPWPCQNRMRLF